MYKKSFLFLFLALLLMACSGKKNAQTVPGVSTVTIDSIPAAESKSLVVLPPLETGEFTLDDEKAFGKDIELAGTHIVEPDTFVFKPSGSHLVLNDSLLILSSRNAPFYVFTQPGFKYVKTIGRVGNGPDEFNSPVVFPSDDPQYVCYLTD